MATMYPPRLPDAVRQDPARRAEVLLYDLLRVLDDDHHVFYSVKWQADSRRGVPRDGEADFVIAHAELGVLVVEVKGGRVEYHGFEGKWVSTDRQGRPRPDSRDPFAQASESCHALHSVLFGQRDWRHDRLRVGYVVVLTDITLPREQPLPPEANRDIIIDATELDHLVEAIGRTFDHWRHPDLPDDLGPDRLAILVDLLDGWIVLPQAHSHAALERRFVELTAQQMFLLDVLRHRPRALIGGCAGSGKTVLAVEKARRLAAAGQRVLLTCFNKPLGEHLARVAPAQVDAMHFHGLCVALATAAGLDVTAPPDVAQDYFNRDLPNLLAAAAQLLPTRYDALLVDEAQDFRDEFWLALCELLADPDESSVYVFFDTHQDLYNIEDGGLPAAFRMLVDEPPFDLSRNCRSTRAIHRVAMASRGDRPTLCDAPEGSPIEILEVGGAREQQRAVRQLLHRLVHDDGVPSAEIVILTGHKNDADDAFPAGLQLGNFTLTGADPPPPGQVLVSTAQRFKGLERRAVIVADVDDQVWPDPESVLYVACSRAQEHLAIVAPAGLSRELVARLRQASADGLSG